MDMTSARAAILAYQLRASMSLPPFKIHPDCAHKDIPCVALRNLPNITQPASALSNCKIQALLDQWVRRDQTYPNDSHPLVQALGAAGCDRLRARMVVDRQGYGMQVAEAEVVVEAWKRLSKALALRGEGSHRCSSCAPGSNTAMYRGDDISTGSSDSCFRIPVCPIDSERPSATDDKILCIGHGGELRWCGPREFMAVSHVWEHGWQGTSEDGVCSKTLEALLEVAAQFDIEYVWLDIAMISAIKEIRAKSINYMNAVYSSAKVTVVWDRLLLAAYPASSAREKAVLIALSDWMTRVWTMQEALLSRNLVFMFGNTYIRGMDLIEISIDYAVKPELHWQQYGAIADISGMLDLSTSKVLDRIHALSKERLTTKKEDLARSLYPLFKLKWPGASFTLEEGQRTLLEHLGDEAPRCHPLHGPIMPRPWSWAPMTVAGCSGGLADPGMMVTPYGLRGVWAFWPAKFTRIERMPDWQRSNGYGSKLARLTGTNYDIVILDVEGEKEDFVTVMFHREDDILRLLRCELLLLRAFNTGQVRMQLMDDYQLVEIENAFNDGDKLLHRVGSCMGGLDGHKTRLVVPEDRVRGWME